MEMEVGNHEMPPKCHNYVELSKEEGGHKLHDLTVIFNVEEALLRSPSMFPYFMLTAFEGGGLLRALVLLLLYPFIHILGEEMGLEIMVFVCFFGIKRERWRIGRSVMPKFFLENVGCEGFEMVMRFGRKVGVSNLPRVMIEGFLKDYLGVEEIVGREIKTLGGYFLGVMGEGGGGGDFPKEIFEGVKSQVVGIVGTQKSIKANPFNHCKDIYLVSKEEKKKLWHNLPRDKYPKPLVFHDGRLAFTPTPLRTLVMFIWLPFGIILCIIRIMAGLLLPYSLSNPILAFIGLSYSSSKPLDHSIRNNDENQSSKGLVFVCNHRTVVDPIFIEFLCRTPLAALVYSISKCTEVLAGGRTISLTRDREKDAEIMREELSKRRTLVIFPEGTTCREPFLLRFSPMFAEVSDNIVPLAIRNEVGMFYGTTASGAKALDPFFLLLNPWSCYHVVVLDKLAKEMTCGGGGRSKFDVANHVQERIGEELWFKCTDLTRKDKYLMLAGNSGLVTCPSTR